MFTCFICTECTFPDASCFVSHIQIYHSSLLISGPLKCTYENCFTKRVYDKYNSFLKHVKTHKSCVKTVHSSTVTERDLNISDIEVPESSSKLENEIENVEGDVPLSSPSVSSSGFDIAVTNSVVAHIATMYDQGLTESQVQSLIDSHRQLLGGSLISILKQNVLDVIHNSANETDTTNITRMFDSLSNMYDGFETTYKRHKELQSCGAYIPPEPYVIGQALLEKKIDGNVVMEPTTLTGQFVPTRKVLKGFLELAGVLSTIRKYVAKLESDTSGRISNIMQATLWKEKIKPMFEGKLVLPIILKFDDYEPNKSLGAHAGVYNLGAGYVRLPCLPPQYQGALENIFLSTLFHTCDKFYGNEKLFRKVLEELKYLEEVGITAVTEEGIFQVFFALCIAGGDNKGANEILGFVACFSANFYCRICFMHRKEACKAVCSDSSLLRTCDSYDKDMETDNVTLTGRKGACVFNELKSFHVYENFHLDIMHDLDEGVWKYLLTDIVKYFLKKGTFTLEYLNERIQAFYYGPNEERNKPPLILEEHLKKDSTVKGSASEIRCLLRYLCLMIGHLINVSDPVWKLYLKARSITDIVTAPSFGPNDPALLKCLIRDHHSEYQRIFKTDLKPKFHFATHIPEVMVSIGPLEPVSCLRIEAEHKKGVAVARKSNSRINLPKTVANRYQLDLSFRLLSGRGLVRKFECSRAQLSSPHCIPNYLLFVSELPLELQNKTLPTVKWVQTNGMKYQEKSVVLISVQNSIPQFGVIHSIFLSDSSASLVVKLLNCDFDFHYHSYEVSHTNSWKFLPLDDLYSYVATEIRTAGNGKKYVSFRYSVNNC